MFLFLFLSLSFASDCSLKKDQFWSHYADEWGHEENKPETLKLADLKIGDDRGLWLYLPRTCKKEGCNVSFLYKSPNKDCWKPLVSVQGKVRTFKQGDWSRFKNTYVRSSVNVKKTDEQIWVFDVKEKIFRQEVKK